MTRIATAHPRPRWAVLLAVAVAVIFPLATVSSASAATTPQATKLGNFKVTYKDSWTFKSRDIGICVTFTASGNVTYTVSQSTAGRYQLEDIWTKQSLNNPTLKAVIHGYNGGRCNSAAKATGMDMGQDWTGYACSFNPSLSFSVPWAVSLGFWPSCQKRNRAEYHHHYPGTYSSYTQYNSGDPAGFGRYISAFNPGLSPAPPCYGVYVSGTAYKKNKTDSYVSGSKQVCLSKY
jgi:hypothetical protein